jgi:hypothetical protein
MTDELLRAIDLALENQWDVAHRVVQQYESDPTTAWIHAVLHKIEGDLDNSRYWYRRPVRWSASIRSRWPSCGRSRRWSRAEGGHRLLELSVVSAWEAIHC